MLYMEPTKAYAGCLLYGDYYDLKELYETLYYITEAFPYGKQYWNLQDYALGLCYDIRHAYQGQREIVPIGIDSIRYYGVKILWPELLFQFSLIQWFSAFVPMASKHHAHLYRLRACLEQSLKEINPLAEELLCKSLYMRFGYTESFLVSYVNLTTNNFIEMTKSERKKNIINYIFIDEISKEYIEFRSAVNERAKELGCNPKDIKINYKEKKINW